MQIADKHIAKFQELYLKNFGNEISREEALEKGTRLVRLMGIVAKHHASKERRKA